jgi:histidinol phosphatase-like enzyme
MSQEFFDMLKKSKLVIALDFDGVIHKDDKGYHDGTIYGNPIDGVESALEHLSKSYTLVIYSCKSNPMRPLVDGKNGKWYIENNGVQLTNVYYGQTE